MTMSATAITWNDVKNVINKSKDEKKYKGYIQKFVSKSLGVATDAILPFAGAGVEEITERLFKKYMNMNRVDIFIDIAENTVAFGIMSDNVKAALRSLTEEGFNKMLEKMQIEVKSWSDNKVISGSNFNSKDFWNGFMSVALNLEIVKEEYSLKTYIYNVINLINESKVK